MAAAVPVAEHNRFEHELMSSPTHQITSMASPLNASSGPESSKQMHKATVLYPKSSLVSIGAHSLSVLTLE
jgi:hypothetical protein